MERWHAAKGAPLTARLERTSIEDEQRRRDEKRARQALMTPVERRRDDVREIIAATLADDDRYHLHSVLALCGFPYKRPPADRDHYIREYGKNSLAVQAGFLKDPLTGKMVQPGLPYGPKARLLMIHICTMAMRQNSHVIEVADSMSALIRDLGFKVTGGQNGTINLFKEQLNRLAAAHMQLGLWSGDGAARTIKTQAIDAFDIWLPQDPDQKQLWSSTLYLNKDFFASLKEHAMPIDIRSLKAFSSSSRQIDIVLWLAWRLRTVDRRYPISWTALKEQFGKDIERPRKFRQTFATDIEAIREVFPKLPVKLTEQGIMLFPSDPGSLFVPPKRLGK